MSSPSQGKRKARSSQGVSSLKPVKVEESSSQRGGLSHLRNLSLFMLTPYLSPPLSFLPFIRLRTSSKHKTNTTQTALKSSIMVEKPTDKLRTTDKITTMFEIAGICLAAATTVVVAKQSWSSRKEAPNELHKR